jgi:hypothetical protein
MGILSYDIAWHIFVLCTLLYAISHWPAQFPWGLKWCQMPSYRTGFSCPSILINKFQKLLFFVRVAKRESTYIPTYGKIREHGYYFSLHLKCFRKFQDGVYYSWQSILCLFFHQKRTSHLSTHSLAGNSQRLFIHPWLCSSKHAHMVIRGSA